MRSRPLANSSCSKSGFVPLLLTIVIALLGAAGTVAGASNFGGLDFLIGYVRARARGAPLLVSRGAPLLGTRLGVGNSALLACLKHIHVPALP